MLEILQSHSLDSDSSIRMAFYVGICKKFALKEKATCCCDGIQTVVFFRHSYDDGDHGFMLITSMSNMMFQFVFCHFTAADCLWYLCQRRSLFVDLYCFT
jgi:hypothetical protein